MSASRYDEPVRCPDGAICPGSYDCASSEECKRRPACHNCGRRGAALTICPVCLARSEKDRQLLLASLRKLLEHLGNVPIHDGTIGIFTAYHEARITLLRIEEKES